MNREYIDYIEQLLDLAQLNDTFCLTSREFNEFSAKVLESLEKQIPKKPLTICPMCEITIFESDEYCWHCAQKLDWSEE